MEKRKIRYAVVGMGHITQVAVLPAFDHVDNAELVALVSGDRDKLDALSKRYGVSRCVHYDDYDELLASGDVDAVYIALPNHLHCEYTVRAAKHGVHVLCEKPMAVTEDECRQMMQACSDGGVRLMIAYRLHFEAANLQVIRRCRKGELGELRYFSSSFSQDVEEGDIRLMPIDQGGGSIYDLGVYCINAARYLFADEPVAVSAVSVRGDEPRFADSDMTTSVVMHFPNDRTAAFTTSFGSSKVSDYRIVGTKGHVHLDQAYQYATEMSYDLVIDGKTEHQDFQKRDQFGPELRYFADCILEDRKPEPDGREGMADIRIVRAIYEAARTGRRVELEPVAPQDRPQRSQEITYPGIEKPEEVKESGPSD